MSEPEARTFGDYLREMQEFSDGEIHEWAAKQLRMSGGIDERYTERFNRIKAARTIKQQRETAARLNGKNKGKWL